MFQDRSNCWTETLGVQVSIKSIGVHLPIKRKKITAKEYVTIEPIQCIQIKWCGLIFGK